MLEIDEEEEDGASETKEVYINSQEYKGYREEETGEEERVERESERERERECERETDRTLNLS